MSPEDAEEYTQALGQVVAGGWRQVALGQRLGVPRALGVTVEEWVQNRLGGYVRLSVQERREAVKELTAPPENGGGGLSTRQAGEVLGVDNATVWRDLNAVANATGATATDVACEDAAVANATGATEMVRPQPDRHTLEERKRLEEERRDRDREAVQLETAIRVFEHRLRDAEVWAAHKVALLDTLTDARLAECAVSIQALRTELAKRSS